MPLAAIRSRVAAKRHAEKVTAKHLDDRRGRAAKFFLGPGRDRVRRDFLSLHVKDEVPASSGNEKYESAILGAGIVNVKDVIALVGKHNKGVHYIIEQESYQGKRPLDCAKEDLAIMKSWGY